MFCCIASTEPQSSRANIGYATGCRAWIVDPRNHNILCEVGEVGELVIEGEILARGYLGDPQRTAKSFVTWAGELRQGVAPRRLYKTGDLARFERDGSLSCLGRKDRQVKIRGQRVELGDVESHIMQHGRDKIQTAVVEYAKRNNTDHLIAFLMLEPSDWKASLQERWDALRDELELNLLQTLPSYMVPNYFVPMTTLPKTTSGKADRALLLKMFDEEYLARIQEDPAESITGYGQELDPVQDAIKAEVARVLSLSLSTVDLCLGFLQLGGNSLLAIKLVARLRKQGLQLATKDVLLAKSLVILATQVKKSASKGVVETAGRQRSDTHISTPHHLRDLKPWAAYHIGVSTEAIQSLHSCTPFQESLMPSLARRPCTYVAQYSFELPGNVDIDQFKSCWDLAYQGFPILRSRFLLAPENGPVRVVVDEEIVWLVQDHEFSHTQCQGLMDSLTVGSALSVFALQVSNGRYQFILTLHHLLFDEWSLQLCLDHVAQLYNGMSPQIHRGASFDPFVDFSVEAARSTVSRDFWLAHLSNFCAGPFPRLPSPDYQPMLRDSRKIRVEYSASSALIRASLALAIGAYTGLHDVCFGTVMSGRDADMPFVDEVVGPTLATVPVRIAWDPTQTIADFAGVVKTGQELASPHEHLGLQNIRKTCTGATNACEFQTMLVIQAPSPRDKTDDLFGARTETENRDSHALVLECTMAPGSLTIEARFDTSAISTTQCERLLGLWTHILEQLLSLDPNTRLVSLRGISNEDLDTLALWNESVPPPAFGFVHDGLAAWARVQPNEVALDSWDGCLTYLELDGITSRLAALLVAFNPSKIIPLHFPKGLPMVVAIWAVLKSGRAFLSLDIEAPADRVATIMEQLDNPLVLSHDAKAMKALLPVHCWTVNRAFLAQLPRIPRKWRAPRISPHDLAYLIMTSGSTGRPKGVMIEHESIMTTVVYSGPCWGIKRSSRMLQFASVAFDAAVMDMMAAVVHGACLCVPEQVTSLDSLTQFMKRKRVNWSFFTPSFLRLIKPSELPDLVTVVAGGEALTHEAAESWAASVHLVNAYGPSECAITCASTPVGSDCANITSIGRAIGCATWIVDPEDHDRLMPIGAVGELLIEGAIVGRGYLEDSEKTAAAFISAPSWASQFRRDFARMYKTGDLVRYDDSGCLVYVGRKDNQVKLRGQRLELGEVEHHTGVAASSRPALCFVPKKGPLARRLVAVLGAGPSNVVPTSVFRPVALEPDDAVHADIRSVRDGVSKTLPRYMVPERIAILHDMPITISGKLDRKAVAAWIDQLAEGDERLFSAGEGDGGSGNTAHASPTNSIEAALQSVWAAVLGMPLDKAGTNHSFQALGGDSITAMQAVARSRNRGLEIDIKHLLRGDTIQTLATMARPRPDMEMPLNKRHRVIDWPFALSPIQRAYVALAPADKAHHFNQSLQVRLRRPISTQALSDAMRAVVGRHASLRTRYHLSTPGASTQRVTQDIEGSFTVSSSRAVEAACVTRLLQVVQTIPNPTVGPIIHCELIYGPDDLQRVILVAPHLAVDIVSWRLILEDLEGVLEGNSPESRPPESFQEWCESKLLHSLPELDLPPPRYDYWDVDPATLTYEGVARESFSLDTDTTASCLGKSNECLRTKPTDLFIAALIMAFQKTFHDRNSPAICLEGHGRQPVDGDVDISNTVGWFTTVLPIHAPCVAGQDLVEIVRNVKDARFQAEKTGADFFAAQTVSLASELKVPEILMNFTGVHHEVDHDAGGGLFLADPDGCGDQYDFSDNMRRFAVFDVAACVKDGRLHFEFLYSPNIKYSANVRDWISNYNYVLQDLSTRLALASPQPTLSDYPHIALTYPELYKLESHLQGLGIATAGKCDGPRASSIYPATPLQVQMLRAQQVNSNCWCPSLVFRVATRDGSPIELQGLSTAWRQVIAAHQILRTILIPDTREGMAGFLNVVVEDYPVARLVDISTAVDFRTLPRTEWQPGEPQHLLTILKHSPTSALCRLEINHALIDHGSMPMVLDAFSQAYAGKPAGMAACPYQEYAAQLAKVPADAGVDFWRSYLKNAHASRTTDGPTCDVRMYGIERTFATPIDLAQATKHLAKASETTGITPATILRLAWALVLGEHTRKDDVVFGFLVSGRDAPFDNIDRVVGPVFNIVACRVPDIKRGTLELLRRVQDDFFAGSKHQHYLATYLAAERTELFDSVVNFRRHGKAMGGGKHENSGPLVFEELPGISEDPYEVN